MLSLAACGLQTEVESSAVDPNDLPDGPSVEDAVFISQISVTPQGIQVLCRLNDILHDLNEDIPVFIEFEGQVIESKVFQNGKATVPFKHYNPPQDGNLICVIQFADAEFESQPLFIQTQ